MSGLTRAAAVTACLLLAGALGLQAVTRRELSELHAATARLADALEREGSDGKAQHDCAAELGRVREHLARLEHDRDRALASQVGARAGGEGVAQAAGAAGGSGEVESRAAFEEGEQLIARALAARSWTDPDADALRALIGRLTREELDVLMARLIPAINRQEVKADVAGPLF